MINEKNLQLKKLVIQFFFSENFLKGLRNNGSPCKTRENK